MTIRRDLNGHNGPVVLLGGYIVLEPRRQPLPAQRPENPSADEKRRAARHALRCLKPIRWLFDCGQPRPIIDAIDNALPFTGVCYSLNTFLALQENPSVGPFSAAASSMPAMPFLNRSVCRIRSAICARTSPFIQRPASTVAQGATRYNLEGCRLNTGR